MTTARRALAGASSGSRNPKSAVVKVYAVSSVTVSVPSVPSGA